MISASDASIFRSGGMTYGYDYPLGPWLDESRNPQHTEVWLRPVRPSQDVKQACRRFHQMRPLQVKEISSTFTNALSKG